MRLLLIPLCLTLVACGSTAPKDMPTRAQIADSTLPPMKSFGATQPVRSTRSNGNIAYDFLDLSFQLESGRELPVFSRFETPISVMVTGAPPASLGPDLTRLIRRLRTEAGIDISQSQTAPANITIQAVTRAEIRRTLPQAACFVVPNVSSLAEYRSNRRSQKTNWAALRSRTKMAIFLPSDASPQEIRDCMHEELAQALGPLNDLYRLSDSVFNDDNIHTVLTAFDMTILRATYAPELRSGMTKQQVAARLPAILARINPAGNRPATRQPGSTSRAWINAVQSALGPGSSASTRRRSAAEALKIAQEQGWQDNRLAFSHYVSGRLIQSANPLAAFDQFIKADRAYASLPDTQLHRAYVAAQIAAYAISDGEGAIALRIIDPYIGTASQYENAALLATLMLMRAEALDLTGRTSEAQRVRVDSLGWARYGFGPDWAVRGKMREIAQISPLQRDDG
jgi:Protein of unknown function (DUF2927)